MPRGRKPKATAVKERSGSLKKNPQRRNKNEPVPPAGIPPMPETISSDAVAKKQWGKVCDLLGKMGILSKSDVYLIESFCLAYSGHFQALELVKSEGLIVNGKRHPALIELHKCRDQKIKLLAEMGLTPSSRTRLSATQEDETEDPFLAFIKRRESRNN